MLPELGVIDAVGTVFTVTPKVLAAIPHVPFVGVQYIVPEFVL